MYYTSIQNLTEDFMDGLYVSITIIVLAGLLFFYLLLRGLYSTVRGQKLVSDCYTWLQVIDPIVEMTEMEIANAMCWIKGIRVDDTRFNTFIRGDLELLVEKELVEVRKNKYDRSKDVYRLTKKGQQRSNEQGGRLTS